MTGIGAKRALRSSLLCTRHYSATGTGARSEFGHKCAVYFTIDDIPD
jgi:hypothetical protein